MTGFPVKISKQNIASWSQTPDQNAKIQIEGEREVLGGRKMCLK